MGEVTPSPRWVSMHPRSGRYPLGQPDTHLIGDGALPNELAVTQMGDHSSDRIAVNRLAAVKLKKITSPGPTQNWTRNCKPQRGLASYPFTGRALDEACTGSGSFFFWWMKWCVMNE